MGAQIALIPNFAERIRKYSLSPILLCDLGHYTTFFAFKQYSNRSSKQNLFSMFLCFIKQLILTKLKVYDNMRLNSFDISITS